MFENRKLFVGQGNQVCLSDSNYFRCWKNNEKTHTSYDYEIDIVKNNVGVNQFCYYNEHEDIYTFKCKSFDGSQPEYKIEHNSHPYYNKVAIGSDHLCYLSFNGLTCLGSKSITDNIPSILTDSSEIKLENIKSNSTMVCVLYKLTEQSDTSSILCWGETSIKSESLPYPVFTFLTDHLKQWELGKDTLCVLFEGDSQDLPNCLGSCLNGMCLIPPYVKENGQELALGYDHACSRFYKLHENRLVCWGGNQFGQLNVPDEFENHIQEVSVGYYISCALKHNNKVKCWGLPANLNKMEYIRNGFDDLHLIDDQYNYDKQTEELSELDNSILSIAVGGRHSCSVLRGRYSCWGANEFGQIEIEQDKYEYFHKITAGFDYTCYLGVTNHIDCIGFNYIGQTDVPENMTKNIGVYSLSAGLNHTCAIIKDFSIRNSSSDWKDNQKEIYCWGGLNEYGQNEPFEIGESEQFWEIAAGHEFTCISYIHVRKGIKTFICQGSNSKGQTDVSNINNLDEMESLTLGGEHGCLISKDIYCWGDNNYGQSTPPENILKHAGANVSAGDAHTCGFNQDYWAVCWGQVQFEYGHLRGSQVASKHDYICIVDYETQQGKCTGYNNYNGQCDVPNFREQEMSKLKVY